MSALMGSGGFLSLVKQIDTFPSSVLFMINQTSNPGELCPVRQMTASADRQLACLLDANGVTTYASHRNQGGAPNGYATVNSGRTTGTWYAVRLRFHSLSSRDLVVGALSNFGANTTTVDNDLALHDILKIGESLVGMMAEVGIFNGTAVSDADYTAYRAGTLLVENMTGVTLAASLLTVPTSATTLTAETGQTMTVNGTVTQGSSHPVTRTSAPVLSSASSSATSATTIGANVTTDTGSGTLYALVNSSTTATNSAIAGSPNSQVISSTGAKTISITGLTPGSTYYVHYVQVVGGIYSNVINSSSITMPAAGAPGAATINSIVPGNSQVSVGYTAGAANGATITGHVLKLYRASDNVLVTTSASSLTSPITASAINGIAVYAKIESTNSAGTTSSAQSGSVTPSATVVTSTITPPNIPLATAAGVSNPGTVWASEAVKIVIVNGTDPTQANQVFNQTTSSVGKLSNITISGAAGFVAQVMVWRVADRTYLGAFSATSV